MTYLFFNKKRTKKDNKEKQEYSLSILINKFYNFKKIIIYITNIIETAYLYSNTNLCSCIQGENVALFNRSLIQVQLILI